MPRNPDRPLSREEQLFARHYVRERDVARAARKARLKQEDGIRMYMRKHVRAEIDRQLAVVQTEQAKIDAQDIDRKVGITGDILDEHLLGVLRLPPEQFGPTVLKALGLGYVLQGKIRQGNTQRIDPGASTQETMGVNIYRSIFSQAPATPVEPAAAPAAPAVPAAQAPEVLPPAPPPAPAAAAPIPTRKPLIIRAY